MYVSTVSKRNERMKLLPHAYQNSQLLSVSDWEVGARRVVFWWQFSLISIRSFSSCKLVSHIFCLCDRETLLLVTSERKTVVDSEPRTWSTNSLLSSLSQFFPTTEFTIPSRDYNSSRVCVTVPFSQWDNFSTLWARELKFVVGPSYKNLLKKWADAKTSTTLPPKKQSRWANFYNFRPISLKFCMEVTNGGIKLK